MLGGRIVGQAAHIFGKHDYLLRLLPHAGLLNKTNDIAQHHYFIYKQVTASAQIYCYNRRYAIVGQYDRGYAMDVLIIQLMSLFKLKSLWSKTFANEEFDEKHLAMGTISKQPAIALANFKGALHVFLISAAPALEVTTIYQNQFQSGIIAVQFVMHPDERVRTKTVGVLLFRKFTFVTLQNNGRNTYQAKLMSVEIEPSFGIGIGPLSVMTVNSSVQTLNPRQIHKIKVADPIYPFAQLLTKLYFMDGEELVQLDGSTEQWRIIVGRARQLFAFVDTVLVIGEKAIWEVSQAKIIKTKVVDQEISCGAIAFLNNNAYNILIANFSGQLFVYSSNYELLWAVKLEYVPVKLLVSQQPEIKGMLVLLSEQGCLELGYSGVEMPQHVVEPLSEKIDFSRVEEETLQLMARGADKGAQKKSMQKVNEETRYKLYFGELQKSYQGHQEKSRLFQIDGKLVKFQLYCEVLSRQNLRNFRVQINSPYNISCAEEMKELKVAKNKDRLIFTLFASNELYPYQREMNVVIRYENNEQSGTPFISNQTISLPMGLQCLIEGFETKETFQNKIIIKSNLQLPSFNQTFPEFFSNNSAEQRKSVKFLLANGVECTIGYNKSFNKAKIQSPYYSGLCYIISEFANHIRSYNKKTNSKIQLSVEIPLEQFFAIMKQHYEHRQRLKKAFKQVELKSEQFRNTQKKLLLRMKEKMSNLGNIDKLLEFTYERLMESASKYEQANQQMDIINHNLSVAINLVIELLFIRSNPSQKAKDIALGILGYEKESLQKGWEDKVMANSAHFLNKKYNKGDQISFQQLQKIPLYVISKVNNGDWN